LALVARLQVSVDDGRRFRNAPADDVHSYVCVGARSFDELQGLR
jgi:hypothetical protein